MKRIMLGLAIVASFLIFTSGQPAIAHGTSTVKATLTLQAVVNGVVPRMDGSFSSSEIHVSATIEIYLHQNSKTGPIVFFDSAMCTNCRTVTITRYYGGPCSNGQKYILQAFGWARQDSHLLKQAWSQRITCPITV